MNTSPFPSRTLIIAEAGVNHNGNLKMAEQLIYAAKKAGADYVKFQTAIPSSLVASSAPKAEYQKKNSGGGESQLEMLSRLLLPFEDFITIQEICESAGIGFMSTPFDFESLDFLCDLGQDYLKIPSGEITNLPYLRDVASIGIPVIMSTGMSTLEEVGRAVNILIGEDPLNPYSRLDLEDICLLHCNTQYPTPYKDVNLRAMLTLGKKFKTITGYSDHTPGIEVPIAAVAMGARVIEKHFTLSRTLPGPDHKASLEPEDLTSMVQAIRHIEEAMGSKTKKPSKSELPNMAVARKSIVASTDIKKGEIFSKRNLTVKRPGTGISPMLWDEVIGKAAIKDFEADELITI